MEDHLPSVVKFDVLTNKEKSLGKTVPSEIKNKVKEVGVISLSTPKVSMLVNQKGISYHHLVFILNIPHSQVTKGTDQCKKEVPVVPKIKIIKDQNRQICCQVKTLTGSLDKSLKSLEKARNQYAK